MPSGLPFFPDSLPGERGIVFFAGEPDLEVGRERLLVYPFSLALSRGGEENSVFAVDSDPKVEWKCLIFCSLSFMPGV